MVVDFDFDIAKLQIVSHPDPVLRKKCVPIEAQGEKLAALTAKMCDLMHAHKGVGLAAPQVGLPWRVFVWNPTGEPENDQVCVNPRFVNLDGQEEGEEGCLSIVGVTVRVKRAIHAEIEAERVDGSTVRFSAEGLPARIWQHETDHLDGRLILDYMSPGEEIANRRALKELEAEYAATHKRSPRRRRR